MATLPVLSFRSGPSPACLLISSTTFSAIVRRKIHHQGAVDPWLGTFRYPTCFFLVSLTRSPPFHVSRFDSLARVSQQREVFQTFIIFSWEKMARTTTSHRFQCRWKQLGQPSSASGCTILERVAFTAPIRPDIVQFVRSRVDFS